MGIPVSRFDGKQNPGVRALFHLNKSVSNFANSGSFITDVDNIRRLAEHRVALAGVGCVDTIVNESLSKQVIVTFPIE
jgi:hypothetical protein